MEEFNSVIYNGQAYNQSVGIFRSGENLSKVQKDIKYDISLDNKSITVMDIISDVINPILYGTINYIDKSLDKLPNVIPDGYSYLNISITKLDINKNVRLESFAHIFVIDDIELVDIKTGEYKISFKSIYWYIFDNYTLYSSIDQNKSYTKMLYEILNLNNEFIHVDGDYRDSIEKGDFMTHCNMSLIESVYELLGYASDTENGFFFLQYDMRKNSYHIRDIKTQYKNYQNAGKTYNIFILETPQNTVDAKFFMARNIESKKQLSIEEYSEFVKDFIKWDYDYTKKEYTKKEYNIEKIKKYFPKASSKNYKVELKDIPNSIPNTIRRTTGEKLGISFRDNKNFDTLFLLTNTIEFECDGRLDRKGGDVLAIEVSKNDYYRDKYKGVWFTGKVYHRFSSTSYTNIFQASRLENLIKMDQNR